MQGITWLSLIFYFALENAFRSVQVYQDDLKLWGTHQIMFYAYDVYIIDGSVYIIEKNPEALVVASKEIVLEVNADKTKYMVMSLDQNARGSQYVEIYDSSFEKWTSSNMWEQPKQI